MDKKVAISELEKAFKYREREVEGFQRKLLLLEEQKKQYEEDLIPKFISEMKEISEALDILRFGEELDLPF